MLSFFFYDSVWYACSVMKDYSIVSSKANDMSIVRLVLSTRVEIN